MIQVLPPNPSDPSFIPVRSFDSRAACEGAIASGHRLIADTGTERVLIRCLKTDESVSNETESSANSYLQN